VRLATYRPAHLLWMAVVLSVLLHIVLWWAWFKYKHPTPAKADEVVLIQLQPEEPKPSIEKSTPATNYHPQGAYLDAPPPPSAEDWAFAAKYSLKNSKAYRHTWGQQVRSMMGTAYEGIDQGEVRFRIEIAPNGSITSVKTLWKTSDVAEALARKAIYAMSPPPPTPTGKPLVFERTISFTPYATDDTPFYGDDCIPDPPSFSNPFAWDGKSPQVIKPGKPAEKLSPEALAECLKQLPKDSIESITAHNQRQLNQWSSGNLNPKK
jgi:TonB family protein